MAGAVGTSVFTTLWERRASLHHARLTEIVDIGGPAALPALQRLAEAGLTPTQTLGMVDRLIDQQAHTMAATDVFLLSGWLYLLLLLPLWTTGPMLARPARAVAD